MMKTQLQKLKRLMANASRNAKRIRNGQKVGLFLNSRWTFWEQVARDYSIEIRSLTPAKDGMKEG